MKNLLLNSFIYLLAGATLSMAQVGIGTDNPAESSLLEIQSADKGMLIPRVDIADLSTQAPVTTATIEESLLVYNTNLTTGKGFYYWNNSLGVWEKLLADNDKSGFWNTEGNSGTTPGTGAGQNFLGTTDNTSMAIATNGIERMRINTLGRIGINTPGPVWRLHLNVGTAVYDGLFLEKQGANAFTSEIAMFRYTNATTGTPLNSLYFENNDVSGNFGFGFSGSVEYEMDDNDFHPATNADKALGNTQLRWQRLFATQNTNVASDRRLKEDIEEISYGLKEVLALKSYSYRLKQDKERELHLGFMAQELKDMIPEVVTVDDSPEQLMGVSYSELIPVLVNAIREQQAIIDHQESQLRKNTKDIAKILALLNTEAAAGTASTAANLQE
ncbi:tail fiber domain-containing protein [Nonlabens xiamenensis]|uniref:tail fiber domain-containing protein n=1 Tax=Nonlabens xiamenensis TaxID=2341043 RepID=UPI000F60D3C7|nr:tail fiber domain-containing protein [Nonlabens xiamenensis]